MSEWLPVESIYLERSDDPPVRPSRPWNQSDVFMDVPLSLIANYREDIETADPQRTRRTIVMLLSHPCVMRAGAAGRPSDQQVVAEVQPLESAQGQTPFASPWSSHYSLFPLPDLIHNSDYAVNFRRIGTTHRQYLEDRRIAVLSHAGWAALQRRFAYHSLRVDLPLRDRRLDTAGAWEELELWERWTSRGFPPDDYQPWLDQSMTSGPYAGQTRRAILEFAADEVRNELPTP